MKLLVIPVFVPHAGCPHNCTFCNQKVISGATKQPKPEDIIDTILIYKEAAPRYDEVQLSFYGGSFTAVPIDVQLMYLKTVQPFLKINGGFIDTLRCSTRPDCIDAAVIERLREYHLTIVELGTQSMVNEVLTACERGHTKEDTIKASKLLKDNGFTLGLQMMTGLPGSDREKDIISAKRIIEQRPDFVRIYPTIIVKNTKMEQEYYAGKYCPQELSEAVSLCAELCSMFERASIKVARIGLQATDTISNGENSEIIAGPYHEAFGQLVKSHRYYELLENMLIESLLREPAWEDMPEKMLVFTDKKNISDVIGQNRQNIIKLKNEFGFKSISVKPI